MDIKNINSTLNYLEVTEIELTEQKAKDFRDEHLNILEKHNISSFKIDASKEIKPPKGLLQMKDFDGGTVETMIRGTIGQIKGKKKVGKTAVINMLCMTLTSDKSFLGEITSDNRSLDILIIDTEQHEYDVQKSLHFINKNKTLKDLNIHVYCLAEFSKAERKEIVKALIYTSENIGVVIIDGIVDLAKNFMDNVESSQLIDDISIWAKQTNTHIISVLHENKSKNDENSRGPLGTELDNKAYYTMRVTKDQVTKTHTLYCSESRTKDFRTIHFKLDDNKMPFEVDEPQKTTKPRTLKPFELSEIEQMRIVKEVFATPLNAQNSVDSLILHFQVQKINVLSGVTEIKRYLQFLIRDNYLSKKQGIGKDAKSTFYYLHSRLK